MSSEKRVILFTIVTFASILIIRGVMTALGLNPEPLKPPVPVAKAVQTPGKGQEKDAAKAKGAGNDQEKAKEKDKGAAPGDKTKPVDEAKPEAKSPAVALVNPRELVLGSSRRGNKEGYHLEVALTQKGAGVASVASSRFEAEFVDGQPRKLNHNEPLQIIREDKLAPPSLAMTLLPKKSPGVGSEPPTPDPAPSPLITPGGGEVPSDAWVWEVVRDDQGRVVRPVVKSVKSADPKLKNLAGGQEVVARVEGQEVVFRTKVDDLGLVLTKTYRLFPGDDAFSVALTFESPEKTSTLAYRLLGPHGIPIEGEWYTGIFRDAFFGPVEGEGARVTTMSALDIAKRKGEPERLLFPVPLRYAGVENQYFATFLEPDPVPATDDQRWDSEALPVVLHDDDPDARQKADIAVELVSRPLSVGPNAPVTHTYKVYAGAKIIDDLRPYGAQDLAAYRKGGWFTIPGAPWFASKVITPLLGMTYELTRSVSALFGGTRGSYGVAIILMTLLVRMAMFPLGRKQALAAKKMQDLQPLLKELQVKYKDDKEAQTRETFALYKRHGVNPVGGCLPALIQLPIFVGLWQALNNSVFLRHAPFLYIENLAAPDMLFKFPAELPFLGNYFNLLPFVVVALMLVQTKLFAPPATTPEAEMQQKMMKYMMVFMAFMFYKVPSGLGIYFITSSLWQISERLLLPKVSAAPAAQADGGKNPPGGGSNGGRGGDLPVPEKPPGRFSQFWGKVMDEASKDPTYRKLTEEKSRGGAAPERDRDNGRDRGKPRAKPGRRR